MTSERFGCFCSFSSFSSHPFFHLQVGWFERKDRVVPVTVAEMGKRRTSLCARACALFPLANLRFHSPPPLCTFDLGVVVAGIQVEFFQTNQSNDNLCCKEGILLDGGTRSTAVSQVVLRLHAVPDLDVSVAANNPALEITVILPISGVQKTWLPASDSSRSML